MLEWINFLILNVIKVNGDHNTIDPGRYFEIECSWNNWYYNDGLPKVECNKQHCYNEW